MQGRLWPRLHSYIDIAENRDTIIPFELLQMQEEECRLNEITTGNHQFMKYIVFIFSIAVFLCAVGCDQSRAVAPITPPGIAGEDFFQKTNCPDVSVSSLAIGAKGVMFAETPGGILRSVDSGMNWQASLTTFTGSALTADTNGYVYASASSGVYSSSDNGSSWSFSDSGLFRVYNDSVVVRPITSALSIAGDGTVFVGTIASGVFRSTNHGKIWSATSMPPRSVRSLCISSEGTVIAGLDYDQNAVFRSIDQGDTWSDSTNITNRFVYCLAADVNGYLYAGLNNYIVVSSDDGVTWSSIGSTDSWFPSIAVTRSDNLYIIVAGRGTYSSTDLGSTWTPLQSGIPDEEERCLLFDSRQFLFAGTDNHGIYRSKTAAN